MFAAVLIKCPHCTFYVLYENGWKHAATILQEKYKYFRACYKLEYY